MIKHVTIPCLFAGMLVPVGRIPAGESEQSPILDVFPGSVIQMPAVRRGKTVFSFRYTPSGSLWDERLDEKQVFHVEMKHKQNEENSFALRVGKGGQLYSLRGPFGESVPPSWRADRNRISPWNDEVWQFVAVCTKYNGVEASLHAGKLSKNTIARMNDSPYRNSFFIHNSGAYTTGDSPIRFLYCPLLGSEVIAEKRCTRTLNWGLVPQLRTVHRSPLLYYTQVRDVGDGVIELTWVVHNFSVRGDIVFDHLNAPWGGTRVTSLPLRYVSSPQSKLMAPHDILTHGGVATVRETGGWNLSCVSDTDDSPSLALVFGRDKHLESELNRKATSKPYCQFQPSLYRGWRASAPRYETDWKDWKTRPANSFRNYDVAEVIPKLRIAPGTTIWYRSFLVVNRRDKAIELAKSLVDKVDYGLLRFDSESTPMAPVFIKQGKVVTDAEQRRGSPAFRLFSRPVNGTMPLFLIRNTKTAREVITTDPYIFVPKEKLDFGIPQEHPHHDYYENIDGYSMDKNSSNWRSLLGFAPLGKPTTGSYRKLSSLVAPSLFPKPNRFHFDVWVSKSGR